MISVGSRDGRKGLSLSYGVEGGQMDLETELEEGEACFQNNNDDDSTIDPDVALSYLDEKLQDVLGHFQKDFEGGVSAENLGAKFGGYGSFLPSYQRSPACPNPRTPPKAVINNASISPHDLHLEGGRQNLVSISNASKHGPPRAPLANGKVKQQGHMSSSSRSNGQQQPLNNFANVSDQKSLKVRIKVGSDNLSARKNAEIYSGLGLDESPSSSLEASPVDSDDFCHVPRHSPFDESPTSILEMMTSFPVLGGLLSPLPYDLLCLTEKEKFEDSSCGSVHKRSQERNFTAVKSESKPDRNVFSENKPKTEDNFVSLEPSNMVRNGIKGVTKKETNMDDFSCEELVSNALRLPLLSDTQSDILDFRKDSAFKKEESLDPVLTHGDFRVEKPYRKDGLVGNANLDEKYSSFSTKADSDVSKSGKVLETGVVKHPKQKAAQKATSRDKDSTKLSNSSSGSKKKSKSQSLENGFQSVEVSIVGLKNESSSSKSRNNMLKTDDSKNNNGKVKETYKEFFGELDPELEDVDDGALDEKPFGDKPKDYRVSEKGALESNVLSKERVNGKKNSKPSLLVYPAVGPGPGPGPGPHVVSTMGNGNVPVSDAASATVAAVVNEDWVCCDKCEKWRLLPPGVNPGSLPEKWLCSMLDWLPGMNRCSISQEETTKAITTQFMGPAPTFLGIHHGGPQSGLTSVDPLHPGQRNQPFGPPSSVKKKHGTKDLPNEPRQERPSLSSNSTKKNYQPSNKTRSLNGANQSPRVNEAEFQDSGQSSSLMAEKHRLKHKEKKKLRENFVDEGNNNALQLKIRNKRETSQDYARDPKKAKTEDIHGTEKDRVSDHEGALFKPINTSINDLPSKKDHRKYNDRSKDPKSSSKDISINPKIENGGKFEERDVSKKRKSHEFEDTQIEETSESGQRKAKKPKIPKSREEETFASKGRLIESSRKDVAIHASLAATSSSSKVSGSHKMKTNNHEAKGSPVESVSSSPLRILNPDKLASSRRNIEGVEHCRDVVSPKKDWEDDRGSYRASTFKKELDVAESLEKGLGHLPSVNNNKVEITPSLEFQTFRIGSGGVVKEERRNDDQSQSNGSRSRKSGKGSSSRSKDKIRNSKTDILKVNVKISERKSENGDEDKSKGGRNKSQEKEKEKEKEKAFLTTDNNKFEKGSISLKKDSSVKPMTENPKKDTQSVQDSKQNVPRKEASGRVKPPLGKGQPFPGSQKENVLAVDGVEIPDESKQKKKVEIVNGNQSTSGKHSTPNRHKGRDHEAPSPLRRESSSQAASAMKEAKTLKHMADRLKNSGSNHESNSLYFQAALKFLYGSSILESGYTESGKHSDLIQSVDMYRSTAKLCEYVAHEFEKSKEMAAAALAYKLAEVAYLKVVYSSHSSASKDRQELHTSLQIGPTGESPSSSASDIDNLNNPAAIDKAALAKGVNDPQIGGNHVIAARNKPNFMRILNFAQDVNYAMEASRRSQIAFTASGSQPEHAHHKEVIKPALDFNFQDVEGLLHLVRVAMEVISR